MAAYIARRVLLMIPTLFGIMLLSFITVQFAPGGPVERIIAQLQGIDSGASARVSGGSGDLAGGAGARPKGPGAELRRSRSGGSQGCDPKFFRRCEQQFGFDKPAHERFAKMIWDYA